MAELVLIKRVNGISNDAVKASTGRRWEEWFKILDKAGARMMEHQDIATHLREQLGMSPWWSRKITIGYEQERGLRAKHQRGNRYTVSRSKTLVARVEEVWGAWQEKAKLERWLPEVEFEVRNFRKNKVMHLRWSDGTKVDVSFLECRGKTKLLVCHGEISFEADRERRYAYWGDALARLKEIVEV
jgi:hypothetical protein